MGREEQIEEREVLDSIFPDEITDITETSYRISIALDFAQDEDDDPPIILLTISYPPSYPDAAPDLDISLPPKALPIPHLSLSTDRSSLLSALEPVIEENLGMAMIFTVVSALKDNIEQLVLERKTVIQAAKDQEARKAEEVENAKFHGEAVTRASFLKWREDFKKEMEERRVEEEREKEAEMGKKKVGKDEKKLTGKELWERGMVGKIEEEGEGEEVDALEKLKVTE